MKEEFRKTKRISDFARATLEDVSTLSGYLEDVCKTGCKVRFPQSLDIDLDQEYTLSIIPAIRSGLREMNLTVQPKWVQASDNSTEIGLYVLPCPDIKIFDSYVTLLQQLEMEEYSEV